MEKQIDRAREEAVHEWSHNRLFLLIVPSMLCLFPTFVLSLTINLSSILSPFGLPQHILVNIHNIKQLLCKNLPSIKVASTLFITKTWFLDYAQNALLSVGARYDVIQLTKSICNCIRGNVLYLVVHIYYVL